MHRISFVLISAAMVGSSALAGAQQAGFMGPYQGQTDRSVDAIERSLSTYLNGDEIKSILSPGEFADWTLNLKAGQVLIAEARSDAFDPALQVVDAGGKVLAANDDRYPGDQRPLLLWRCDKDGAFGLRARCFHDRSGGAFYLRFKTYESIDLSSPVKVEKDVEGQNPFLNRIPMKAGEIESLVHDVGGNSHYVSCSYNATIAPGGLPELNQLGVRLQPAIYGLMAPVAGDYYIMETPNAGGGERVKVHIGLHEIVPQRLAKSTDLTTATAPTDAVALWEVPVKAGDFLEASTPDLKINCQLRVANEPDISKFDTSKPESNPFFPHPIEREDPVLEPLPKRARDNRAVVFQVLRDANLLVASNGAGAPDKQFTLRITSASVTFEESVANRGKLRIADTDYWAFDAKAGDVMSLESTAADLVLVRDPDLREIRHFEPALDQTSDRWRMVVQQPGRYLVAVSGVGNGGSGAYSLSRKAIHPREFGVGTPATAEISDGQVEVWKFAVSPKAPLLVHWTSSNWAYGIEIYDEKGARADFQRQAVDDHNRFGILSATRPETYIVVLTGAREKATYSIELSPIQKS